MNKNDKQSLSNFLIHTKYSRKGKNICLGTIIDDSFKHYGTSDMSMVDFLSDVHPWLYMNYICDWASLPDTRIPTSFSSGENFGKVVIKEWRTHCWKNKMANTGMLNVYSSRDELEKATDEIFEGKLFRFDKTFSEIEEMLYEKKQTELDKAEAENAAKEEQLKEEIELAKLDNDVKALQQKQNELRQRKKEREAEQVRLNNRMMATKDNGPWTADVSKLQTKNNNNPMARVVNKPASTSVADAMPEQLKDGSMFDPEFMTKAATAFDNLVMSVSAKVENTLGAKSCVNLIYTNNEKKDNRFKVTVSYFEFVDGVNCGKSETFRTSSFETSLFNALAWIDEKQAEKEEAEKKQKEKNSLMEQMKKLQEQMQMLQGKINEL